MCIRSDQSWLRDEVESSECSCKIQPNYVRDPVRITQCGSTVYIGIAQVTWHQPCTFENSSFHFHYALHFVFEEISVKNR